VWVQDADETTAKAQAAGGTVLSEPRDAGAWGRMAVLADPAGAAFCVWQAGEHRGAAVVNEPGSLNFNDLQTRDIEGAEAFYGAVFGWEVLDVVASVRLIPDDQPDVSAHWDVTFGVNDADAIAARAAELGGRVIVPPFDAPWVRMTIISDPQGATFTASKFVPENKNLS
jgi:predicted enzyme related to lactoylglutathione lyase